jgi:HK97 family phage major capsid protein
MLKLADLLEKRAQIVARMTAAHEADNSENFNTAEAELRSVDAQIDRQKKVEAADRHDPGTPINGDAKLDTEIRSKFSLARAVAGACGLSVDWGFEREVQPELARRAGRQAKGIYIPHELFEIRAQSANSGPAGGYLIANEHRPDLYISALAAASVTRAMGATVLTGLVGDLSIPCETDSPAIGWVGDNSALSSDNAAFGQLAMMAKHAGALAEWSRSMVLQASPDVEKLMRDMLSRNLALAIDLAAINGSGVGAEPMGILQSADIQTQAYATSIFATSAEMIAKADIANVGLAKRSFLTTNTVKKIGMKALDSNGLPVGLSKMLHDEPATYSNQVPATLGGGTHHGLIYGDWTELMIGIWSEIDILVNPYESTAYSKGNISIRAMATVDTGLRHPAAFVSATGVTSAAAAFA